MFIGREKELPIFLCRQFWEAAADRVAAREILDVLSVTGGVPRYLFSQVFGDYCDVKRSVLEIHAEGPKTCSEIAAAPGV